MKSVDLFSVDADANSGCSKQSVVLEAKSTDHNCKAWLLLDPLRAAQVL
jgi:hypothetical protein